jgi:pyruvate formate lyase activating enzyme
MRCKLCAKEAVISKTMPYCSDCIRERFQEIQKDILKIHDMTRRPYGLPEKIPVRDKGVGCQLCVNKCRIAEGDYGYCGVRQNVEGRIAGPDKEWSYVDWYHDPLPTNCVADWVCRGSSDLGYTNLAVFYEACTFNCLFCQNWHFRDRKNRATAQALIGAADATTGCICFFGGDPTPFALHSLEVARQVRKRRRKIRICWETNGSIVTKYMKKWADCALASDGCIKIDLKTYNENLNIALCGSSNENTKRNIELVAQYMERREHPPILIVSTLLIPGYIDESELEAMAEFISSINKDIPWSFLGFYPHFRFDDMPCTSRAQADMALRIAKVHGIKNTHLGNIRLLR